MLMVTNTCYRRPLRSMRVNADRRATTGFLAGIEPNFCQKLAIKNTGHEETGTRQRLA